MKNIEPKHLMGSDALLKPDNAAGRNRTYIGSGLSVPLYANKEFEDFALGTGRKILNAFELKDAARRLITVYERRGYAEVIQEVERVRASPELVLALLLQRSAERKIIASRNAKSKPDKNHLEQLKQEATRDYLQVKGKMSKLDFAHKFNCRLEDRKQETKKMVDEAKMHLAEEKAWQADLGEQFRRKPKNVKKLNDLQDRLKEAETQASFKVYKPSTIADVWLKGL